MTDTTQAQRPPDRQEDVRAKIRDDLIRRLFAVAISVGAATTIAQMNWVQSGRWPCMAEWQQQLILVAAMTATVLSWDGYLFSIADRPLRIFWRFAIDILLVFIYMVLLMTSKLLVWWLFIHALIFTLYAIWDFLTVYDWLPKYYYRTPEGTSQTIRGVYIGGLRNSPDVSRGPIITIVWGLYFWALYFLNDWMPYWFNVSGLRDRIIGTTLFVVLGLYFYRSDKIKRYSMCRRLGWVAVLLGAYAASFLKWIPTDQTLWNLVGSHIGSASCGP
ncbi:MAG: hypothetical protein GEU95_13810 [Rhizobiales bacterium]|nr:hypothetical protein [Hyphomicrobiales bacterium]